MTCPPAIQKVLDVGKAKEIAAYIERRNKRQPTALTTLNRVCQRFKLNQMIIKRIIDSVDFLVLSHFAYVDHQDKNETSWGKIMVARLYPQLVEQGDVPDGERLVMVIDDG